MKLLLTLLILYKRTHFIMLMNLVALYPCFENKNKIKRCIANKHFTCRTANVMPSIMLLFLFKFIVIKFLYPILLNF